MGVAPGMFDDAARWAVVLGVVLLVLAALAGAVVMWLVMR